MSTPFGNVRMTQSELLKQLREHLGIDEPTVRGYFINSENNIVGFGHVDLIDSLAQPKLAVEDLALLREAYVCLTAALFATDRLIDDQSALPNQDILLSQVCVTRACEVLAGISGGSIAKPILKEITDLFRTNRTSLLAEAQTRNDPRGAKNFEAHAVSAFERGYLFFAAYKIVAAIKGREVSEMFKTFCKTFIYFMQEGDDLGDWREDLLNNRYTPLLQRCIFETNGKTSIDVVERHIYLSGFYEREANRVLRGLLDAREYFGQIPEIQETDSMNYFIDKQIYRLKSVLENFHLVKQGKPPKQIATSEH